jgi:hypothetical protein
MTVTATRPTHGATGDHLAALRADASTAARDGDHAELARLLRIAHAIVAGAHEGIGRSGADVAAHHTGTLRFTAEGLADLIDALDVGTLAAPYVSAYADDLVDVGPLYVVDAAEHALLREAKRNAEAA